MKRLFILITFLSFTIQPYINSQNLWEKIKDNTKQIINQGKEKVKEYYDNNKEKVKEKTREVINNSTNNVQKFNNKYGGSYQKIFDKTKEIAADIKKDPRKISYYKKQADRLVQGAVIVGVKNIPVYDPQTGQMTNMDSYCRTFVKEVGGDAIRGSELEEDPVGLAVMIMMDEDYLLEAKLITTPEGEWISANDALNSNLNQYSVNLLHTDYAEMKNAYQRGDVTYFNQKFEDFRGDVANLSNYCAYSCPWIYIFNGEKFIKYAEIIKDQNSESLDLYQPLSLPVNCIVDNELTILIIEELEETSYLDHIYLEINGTRIEPETSSKIRKLLLQTDDKYLKLEKGESIVIKFNLSPVKLVQTQVTLLVKGYYNPNSQFSKKY